MGISLNELSKSFMIKVFADYIEGHKIFDEHSIISQLKELVVLKFLENIEKLVWLMNLLKTIKWKEL